MPQLRRSWSPGYVERRKGKGEKELTLCFACGNINQNTLNIVFFFKSTELKAKSLTPPKKIDVEKKMELSGNFKVNQQNLASHDGCVSRKEG